MKKTKLTDLKITLWERKNSSPIRGSELIQCATVGQEKHLSPHLPAWSSAFQKSTNTDYSNNKNEHLHSLGVHLHVAGCSGPPRETVLQLVVNTQEQNWTICTQHLLVRGLAGAEQQPVHACKCVFCICIHRYYSLIFREPKDSTACKIFYDFNMLMYYVTFLKITVNV